MWPLPLWSETEVMDRPLKQKKWPLVEVQLEVQPCILRYRVCSRSLRTADVFPSENSSISGRPSNSHIQN